MCDLLDDFEGTSGFQGNVKKRPWGTPAVMYFKGAKKIKETEEERQAKIKASKDYDRSLQFEPIEDRLREGNKKFNKKERTGAVAGKSNAELFQADAQGASLRNESLRTAGHMPGSNQAFLAMRGDAGEAENALREQNMDAAGAAQNEVDLRDLNTVKSGRQVSSAIGQSLSALADNAVSKNISRMNAKASNRSANVKAVGQIGGFAAGGGIGSGLKSETPTVGAAPATNTGPTAGNYTWAPSTMLRDSYTPLPTPKRPTAVGVSGVQWP